MKNLDKILYYLKPLSKSTILVDGKEESMPRASLKLSPTFFYKDSCVSCGRCCGSVPEKIILTESEYQYLQNYSEQDFIDYKLDPAVLKLLKETMKPETHTINGKEITIYKSVQPLQTIYLSTKDRSVQTCSFLFKYAEGQYRCGMHPVRSITCRFPHTAIYSNHHGISIGVKQYGRNWKLGCPTKFLEPDTEESFNEIKQGRIDTLDYLRKISDDLNIETYLPEIIEYIKQCTFDNYKDLLGKDLLPSLEQKSKKLFTL